MVVKLQTSVFKRIYTIKYNTEIASLSSVLMNLYSMIHKLERYFQF